MDYVEKYLHVDKRPIGHGGFGRVLAASPLLNQSSQLLGSLNRSLSPGAQQEFTLGSPAPTKSFTATKALANSPPPEQTLVTLSSTTPANSNCPFGNLKQVDIASEQNAINEIFPSTSNSSSKSSTSGTTAAPARQRLALKWLHSIVRPSRLANELRCLRDLGGKDNVVKMHTAHLNMGSLFIVMDLIEHNRFSDIVTDLHYSEIVNYMKNLLIALRHVHSYNIVHRDIKPTNFLYDRKRSKFLLVDFGLAQHRTRVNLFNATPHQVLQNNAPGTGASRLNTITASLTNSSMTASPMTPKTPHRQPINGFSIHLDGRNKINNSPFIKPRALQQQAFTMKSPTKTFSLNYTNSPHTPNISTKRLAPADINTNEVDQTFKRLRVSNCDETREPVRLTVGAYESPVTNNDNLIRTRPNPGGSEHKFSTPKVPRRPMSAKCGCFGKPRTCSICMGRKETSAPRSGTSGFKAPETLLRSHYQTTAIDIWAAGVIFASLLAGHTPIFRNVDDPTSLAEIITLLGSQRIQTVANQLKIKLTIEPERAPIDLAYLCRTLRGSSDKKRAIDIPDEAFDLLNKMLDPSPYTRITASQALEHPLFNEVGNSIWSSIVRDSSAVPISLNIRDKN